MNLRISIFITLLLAYFSSLVSAEYDPTKALEMIYVSGLTYCPAKLILARNWSKATEYIEANNMDVIYARDNGLTDNQITSVILKRDSTKELFIGFSGTKNIPQLINIALTMFPVSYEIHPEAKGVLVFDYFYKAYVDGFRLDLIQNFTSILKKYPDYTLIFTGHSLGATMVAHTAADFILNGLLNNRTIKFITFGQPRVGNPEFNKIFNRTNFELYRLTHNKDIVPHLPPCIAGILVECEQSGILPFYPYHATQEIFYNEDSTKFTACSKTEGEDKHCSDGQLCDSVNDHYVYLGIDIGQLSGQF